MPGRMEGKVSFITGAGRGQGRAHAVLQAAEGADIIAVDICKDIESNPYPMASWDDLMETKALVESHGRRCIAARADVRNREELRAALEAGLAELGQLTTVCANAGILPMAMGDPEPLDFQDAVDVDLIGVMNTVTVAVPHLIPAAKGAAIIITGSTAALIPNTISPTVDPRTIFGPGGAGYSWSKQTLVGYTQQMALHLAPTGVRVNIVHPTNCNTHLMNSEGVYAVFRPDLETVTTEDFVPASEFYHALPTPWIEPEEVAELVLFLASDASKHMTGASIPIDAGCMIKWPNGPGQG
ncbi:MAG TPA: mycofactocin-coupled SDR family oxidoreductase [Acidimicrobiales bacterium]|nr:mycofactocin-coupled SDR family oxidoreductase [Acidimicrobiales bacterium]